VVQEVAVSDDITPDAGGAPDDKGQEFKPITSQEEFNRLIGDRVKRARPADYDEVKKKADEFDKLSEASKSDLEKAIARAEAAEQKVASFESEKQRTTWADEVSKDTGIPASALRGSTKEELEAHAQELKALIAPEKPKRTTTPPGKAEPESGKGRAAAALRELRKGGS
jgi:ATP-dependent Clp protease ATP-binding subunit ClpA